MSSTHPTIQAALSGNAPEIFGTVCGIGVRCGPDKPLRLLEHTEVAVDGGLEQDARAGRDRGVTLLSAEQWRRVNAELGSELPWHMRRANLLIEGPGSLGAWIGREIEIGAVRLLITGETRPCAQMDRQFAGLRAALEPDCRGGVTARVLRGGAISIGDRIRATQGA